MALDGLFSPLTTDLALSDFGHMLSVGATVQFILNIDFVLVKKVG